MLCTTWFGMVPGWVRYDREQHDTVGAVVYRMILYGAVLYRMIKYGAVLYRMIKYGAVLYCTSTRGVSHAIIRHESCYAAWLIPCCTT